MTETPAPSPAIVRQAFAFFKRPQALRPAAGPWAPQFRPLLALLALNLAGLFLLLPLLVAYTKAMGIEPPQMTRDIPKAALLPLAVLVLPVLEEIAFRGWMTGKRWQLLLLATLAGFAVAVAVGEMLELPLLELAALVGLPLVLGIGLWKMTDRSGTPAWFARQFKWWFWGGSLVFAVFHYSNYNSTGWALAPVVLPQLWSGLIFGFVRLRFGILRAMLLHCASNGIVLAMTYLAGIPGA